MPRLGGGTGDQDMTDGFVIHQNGLCEGDKETAETTLLFAPAMRNRRAIHYQVFTFMLPGANA